MTSSPSRLGILFSTWLSRCPRGMKTDPGMVPASYSSCSRTSRNVAAPSFSSASAGVSSLISDFVCDSSSRNEGMRGTPVLGAVIDRRVKSYLAGRIFPTRGARPRSARATGPPDDRFDARNGLGLGPTSGGGDTFDEGGQQVAEVGVAHRVG